MTPHDISNIAAELDSRVGPTRLRELVAELKRKGKTHIDAYHVSSVEDLDLIAESGIKKTSGWFGNEDGVYFLADVEDVPKAIPFWANKFAVAGEGQVGVTHFRIPVEKLENMRWDGRFRIDYDTYSSFLIVEDIPTHSIVSQKLFRIPSGEAFKHGDKGNFVDGEVVP